MGLKGVPGLHYAKPMPSSTPKRADWKIIEDEINNGDGRSKRARHQGPPEIVNHPAESNNQGGHVRAGRAGGGRGGGTRGCGNRGGFSTGSYGDRGGGW